MDFLCLEVCQVKHKRIITTAIAKKTKHLRGVHFDRIAKHCKQHKMHFGLKADTQDLNKCLVIHLAMQQTHRCKPELMTLLDAISEFTLKHGKNPVKNNYLIQERRKVKNIITNIAMEGIETIVSGVKSLIDKYEKGKFPLIIILGFEIDHKHLKVQKKELGCISMDLRIIDPTQVKSTTCFSFPVHMFDVADKTAPTNIQIFKKYLEENWSSTENPMKYIKYFSLQGDGAVVTENFLELLREDPLLKHFDLTIGKCVYHGYHCIPKNCMKDIFHDCDVKENYSQFIEGKLRTGPPQKLFWWDDAYLQEFKGSLKYFLAMIVKQSVSGAGELKFKDQVRILQIVAIKESILRPVFELMLT